MLFFSENIMYKYLHTKKKRKEKRKEYIDKRICLHKNFHIYKTVFKILYIYIYVCMK